MSSFPPLGPATDTALSQPLSLPGWDAVKLGGNTLPGKCRVSRGSLVLKIDRKKKPGVHGGNPTLQGINPQEFEIEVTVWTNDQLDALLDVCKQILPQPNQTTQLPLVLDNAAIKHLGVIKVLVLGCGILEHAGVGMRKLAIHLQHWLPSTGKKSVTSTPTRAQRVKNDRDRAAPTQNPLPTDQTQNFTPAVGFTPAR